MFPNLIRSDFGMRVPRLQDPELITAKKIATVLANVLSRNVSKSDQI